MNTYLFISVYLNHFCMLYDPASYTAYLMCTLSLSHRHDMTLAVKVALNPNTFNNPPPSLSFQTHQYS